jgi:hypothetical protein
MFVNETAMQNIQQDHFWEPWRGAGGAALCDKSAQGGSGNSNHMYMGHTLRLSFYTFHHKKTQRKDGFWEKCLQNSKGFLAIFYFFKFILFYDFLKNFAINLCDPYMITLVDLG